MTVPLAPATAVTVKLPAPVQPGDIVILGWLDETVQATPLPAAKPTTTDCGLVTSDPDVPKFSTERFKVSVPGSVAAAPDCEMLAVLPPIVRFPLRARELGLAFTDQEAIVPATDTEAQLTPELADAGEQSTGLGVTVMLPVPPVEPTLELVGFRL